MQREDRSGKPVIIFEESEAIKILDVMKKAELNLGLFDPDEIETIKAVTAVLSRQLGKQ